MAPEQFDVLIVGAGLSGIGAAAHVKQALPGVRMAVLEARASLGGTWDVFRYPGVRSDSDMHTLGFRFRPWRHPTRTARGSDILAYLHDTVAEHDLARHIRLQHRVVAARWDRTTASWHVEVKVGAGPDATQRVMCARWLHVCAGYYDPDTGHRPHWPGEDQFTGQWVHPQHWPADLDVRDRQVVVIGSGATAVTLAPALTDLGARVTVLQRSPSYIDVAPQHDALASGLMRVLPHRLAAPCVRQIGALRQVLGHRMARKWPHWTRRRLLGKVAHALGDRQDLLPHFTPRYRPWDQRLCLAPDGDFFRAVRQGRITMVTDEIAHVVQDGLVLNSGQRLQADVIVTATGLTLRAFGGMPLSVDGQAVTVARTYSYRGWMLAGVPNFSHAFGYTHASWTLKAELAHEQMTRILRHLARTGLRQCTPCPPTDLRPDRRLDFTPGYVLRSLHCFPKAGDRGPWRALDNAALDRWRMWLSGMDDGALVFDNPGAPHQNVDPQAEQPVPQP